MRVVADSVVDSDDFDAARDSGDGGPDSYKESHKEWFLEMYAAGIVKARTRLNQYATRLTNMADFNTVEGELKKAIEEFSSNPAAIEVYCVDNLKYP